MILNISVSSLQKRNKKLSFSLDYRLCFDLIDTLTNINEKKAPTQKRDLKYKLCNMKMERDETVASFFTNISQVKDQLASICVETDEDDLLQTAIEEIPASWDTFLATINGREYNPNFKIL